MLVLLCVAPSYNNRTAAMTRIALLQTVLLMGLDNCHMSALMYVVQGWVAGKACAVKLYDSRQPGALQAYFQEKWCLQALRSQASIVVFQMAGRLQNTLYPCIVTAFAGHPVTRLSSAQRTAAKKALGSLHDAAACHGDI